MPTAIVPLPDAAVVTGGTSWLPLSVTMVPPLEDMLAHPATRIAAPPMPAHRDRFTTSRSTFIRLPPCRLMIWKDRPVLLASSGTWD
jgi:hypothetical protein